MGACASVPKVLKAEAGATPPPEPPKEETTNAEAPEVSEVKAEEGEKKIDTTGDDEVVKEEKVSEDSDKLQCLNTLMNENDKNEAKEESSTVSAGAEAVPAEAVPSTTVKVEENKVEPSPVYDTPPKKDDAEKPSTDIAEVTKEEKKDEEITQKS